MIDSSLRAERLVDEAKDPTVAVLLLDFVLGYNASTDPVGDMREAIVKSREIARSGGRHLGIVASVTGTDEDPQDRSEQIEMLETEEVIILPSSAQAAEFAGALVSGYGE